MTDTTTMRSEEMERVVELKPTTTVLAAPKTFAASEVSTQDIPPGLSAALQGLQAKLGRQLWLLIQRSGSEQHDMLDESVVAAALNSTKILAPDIPIAVLIETDGGFAKCAYQAARILHQHCGSFSAVVFSRCKSAGTLFCCGAGEIVMSRYAELGPLDAQVVDLDREEFSSALNEVHAVKQLQTVAAEALDAAMVLSVDRTGKKVGRLLPDALKFAAEFVRPLLANIDVIHYTSRHRELTVGKQYARNLLQFHSGDDAERDREVHAQHLADKLTEGYPDHEFLIDLDEAQRIGLQVVDWDAEIEGLLGNVRDNMSAGTWIGRFEEKKTP